MQHRATRITVLILAGLMVSSVRLFGQASVPWSSTIRSAVALPGRSDSAVAELFLPRDAQKLLGVIVFLPLPLADDSDYAFSNPAWQALCHRASCAMMNLHFTRPSLADVAKIAADAGGLWHDANSGAATAIDVLLASFAKGTGRTDIRSAPLVLWGSSAASLLAASYAMQRPSRTLGFIAYHSTLRRLTPDWKRLAGTPALIVADSADPSAAPGRTYVRGLVESARQAGVPWMLALQTAQHSSIDALLESSSLQLTWLEAMLGSARIGSGETWAPSRATRLALAVTNGPCTAQPLEEVRRLLGEGAEVVASTPFTCQFKGAAANATAPRLALAFSLTGNEVDVLRIPSFRETATPNDLVEFEGRRQRLKGESVAGLGDAAYWLVGAINSTGPTPPIDPSCTLLTVLAGNVVVRGSLCSPDLPLARVAALQTLLSPLVAPPRSSGR